MFRVSRGLHVQAQHSNGFLLSWCSKGGGEPQAEFEDEACTSPRVAEACCYTESGHVRPAGLGDDHHCPVPFLVLHRVRAGRPAIHSDYHHSPVPFLVLHRVWAGEGNFEKQSPVPLRPYALWFRFGTLTDIGLMACCSFGLCGFEVCASALCDCPPGFRRREL